MAQYHYDEAGLMALYFVLTCVSLVLFPLIFSFTSFSSSKQNIPGCPCPLCAEKAERVKKDAARSFAKPSLKLITTAILSVVWVGLVYKVSTTHVESTVYDPFEILGIKASTDEKAIKRHYKKLSVLLHPDKVKLAINQTMEAASARFVEITKAYKSLTDETVRENLEKYGHPDGKQEFSVGIAIPKWIVESKNNGWVLVLYGLIFGGGLPFLVGKWWYGSRQYTKDGVKGRTAELFFKTVKEESEADELVQTVSKAWRFEGGAELKAPPEMEIKDLKKVVRERLGSEKDTFAKVEHDVDERALMLLYAHLLRIPIADARLQQEQNALLLQSPASLTSLLSITLAHNWLLPTLHVMHLHAYLAQALLPGDSPLLQFPGVRKDDLEPGVEVAELVEELEKKADPRLESIRKAGERWGHLEVVDVRFKVIGERIITPQAIVQLVFKLRLVPPVSSSTSQEKGTVTSEKEEPSQPTKADEEKDLAFLSSKKEAEDLDPNESGSGYAHAPYWPDYRKPQWWVLVGDQKLNRVVVPPMKISDIPYSNPSKSRNYRTYKLQFQAPPNVAMYTFQVHFVSDTFVGEDVRRDVSLKVEDLSALTADEQPAEDEISDPEEDSLAGQMAAMRGGSVKKSPVHGDSDDESTTDGDQESDDGSSSDSD